MLKVRDKQTASMQTRDKVRLDADIYRPDLDKEFPVLLIGSTPRWTSLQLDARLCASKHK